MTDYTETAEWREWERNVREDLIPKLRGSALSLVLAPGDEPDVKAAVELGMSILMGKPIVVFVVPGRPVPDKLVKLADAVIEADPETEHGKDEIQRVIRERLAGLVGD